MEQNTQKSALLVMDMQAGILGSFPGTAALLPKVAKAIAHARKNKIPVIFVVVGFRESGIELSENNRSFNSGLKERMAGVKMEDFMRVHPDVAPLGDEPIVSKRRVSAFAGSDLEVILRANKIEHIILSGIATSGVVLSTLVEAADKDYRITVLEDGCADGDEEVHRVLTTKYFSKRGDLVSVDEWTKK